MSAAKPIEGCLDNMPEPVEICRRMAASIRQRQLLRQLLRIAQQFILAVEQVRSVVRVYRDLGAAAFWRKACAELADHDPTETPCGSRKPNGDSASPVPHHLRPP
jgi:hypothetical protein